MWTVKFWKFKFLNSYILRNQNFFEPLFYFEIFEKFIIFWLKKNVTTWPLHFGTGISTVKIAAKFEIFFLYSCSGRRRNWNSRGCQWWGQWQDLWLFFTRKTKWLVGFVDSHFTQRFCLYWHFGQCFGFTWHQIKSEVIFSAMARVPFNGRCR